MRLMKCKAKAVVNKQTNKIYITQPVHSHSPDYVQFCNVTDGPDDEAETAIVKNE